MSELTIIEFLNTVLAEEEQLAQRTATWLQPPWRYDPEDEHAYDANVDIIDDQGTIVPLSWEWDKDEWVYQPRGSERYRLLDAHEPADVAAAAERLARRHSGNREEQP